MALAIDLYVKQNDTAPAAVAVLKDAAGVPIDLTSAASVTFRLEPYAGGAMKVNAAGTMPSPRSGGNVRYAWVAADTDTWGLYRGEFSVLFNDGTRMTSPNGGHLLVLITAAVG